MPAVPQPRSHREATAPGAREEPLSLTGTPPAAEAGGERAAGAALWGFVCSCLCVCEGSERRCPAKMAVPALGASPPTSSPGPASPEPRRDRPRARMRGASPARFRFLRGERDRAARAGPAEPRSGAGTAPHSPGAAPSGPAAAMALALKMLPCKKRRAAAAAAAGPPSPRERGEDAELPGGSAVTGAADGGGSARPAGKGPGEASPKAGRKPPGRAAPSPGQELPAGPGSPAVEGTERRHWALGLCGVYFGLDFFFFFSLRKCYRLK